MEKQKRIEILVSPQVHHDFKCKCADLNTTPTKMIRQWLSTFLEVQA